MTNPSTILLQFTPHFLTSAGTEVARVSSGDSVRLQAPFTANASMKASLGQTFVDVGGKVTETSCAVVIAHTLAGDRPIAFQRELDDQFFFWSANDALQPTDTVEVLFPAQPGFVTVSLLSGSLPPGLSVSNAGLIQGTVGTISQTQEYRFTLRLACDGHVRDRDFLMYGAHEDTTAFFNPAQLQPVSSEVIQGQTLNYRALGTVDRGQGYAFTLDIQTQDGALPVTRVRKLTGFTDPNAFGGLPPDLAVIGQTIQGVISATACPGRYYFAVDLLDAGHASANFMIEVTGNVSSHVGVIPQVIWDTPSGRLGRIAETEPVYFDVAAHTIAIDTVATPVTYTVAPYSAGLPNGIALGAANGRFYGILPYVDSDTTFAFKIRAQAGTVFTDRVFSIDVVDFFDINAIHQLRLKLSVNDEANLTPHYQSILTEAMIFRPEDPNFGLVAHPFVYMIKGLDGTKDLEPALRGDANVVTNHGTIAEQNLGLPVNPLINRDFNTRFELILGPHKFAKARDVNGNVVYDVLYRELYDPMAKAGGFTITDNKPVQTLPRWPQSGPTTRFIYPASVVNMRQDLVADIGLAMNDPDARLTMYDGDSNELLPLWMRTMQTAGVQSSVPGFQCVLLIAYIDPTQANAVAVALNAALKAGSALTPSGHVYHFDKFYTTETAVVVDTEFDNQSPHERADGTFPDPAPGTFFTPADAPDAIVFDEVDGDIVKYLD